MEENENLHETNADLEEVISQQRKEICDLCNQLHPSHCNTHVIICNSCSN